MDVLLNVAVELNIAGAVLLNVTCFSKKHVSLAVNIPVISNTVRTVVPTLTKSPDISISPNLDVPFAFILCVFVTSGKLSNIFSVLVNPNPPNDN